MTLPGVLRPWAASDQPQPLEAGVAVAADDNASAHAGISVQNPRGNLAERLRRGRGARQTE